MCPLNCSIVQKAITAHEERGIVMGEFIEYHKKTNAQCLTCCRNEQSKWPEHLQQDNSNK